MTKRKAKICAIMLDLSGIARPARKELLERIVKKYKLTWSEDSVNRKWDFYTGFTIMDEGTIICHPKWRFESVCDDLRNSGHNVERISVKDI